MHYRWHLLLEELASGKAPVADLRRGCKYGGRVHPTLLEPFIHPCWPPPQLAPKSWPVPEQMIGQGAERRQRWKLSSSSSSSNKARSPCSVHILFVCAGLCVHTLEKTMTQYMSSLVIKAVNMGNNSRVFNSKSLQGGSKAVARDASSESIVI